jgi:Domain of unknown function (DUF4129)
VRGNAARALLPGLAVLSLVGVVAVAATGSTESGSDATRRPSDIVFDTFLSLSLVVLIPGAALLVYGLMQRRAIAQEVASGKYRRNSIVSSLVFALLFAVVWYFLVPRRLGSNFLPGGETSELENLRPRPQRPEGDGGYEPEFAWIPVLVLVGLVAIGIGAYFLAARRRARAFDGDPVRRAEEVADEVDESLDDLRAEPDARRAVIAAYARLERALGASGASRSRHETAEEHVARILGELEVDDRLVRRLADLFTRAKFSDHAVDETMKEEAIAALEQIRDELRAAARARLEESTRQLAERTATS